MSVALTHPDRLVFPDAGITKHTLARHYERVAPWMLPHLRDRPLAFVRCPRGIGEDCFFQKHPQRLALATIETFTIEEKHKHDRYMSISNEKALREAVQHGVVELHMWGSRRDRLECPDRLVFDLDPGEGVDFGRVREAARDVRSALRGCALRSFVMTTGGAGLHVVVPVVPEATFERAAQFTRMIAEHLRRQRPEAYVTDAAKAARRDRVFLDVLRNTRGATAICPYAVRNRRGAPVATPLRWDELARIDDARHYRHATIFRRLAHLDHDAWNGYFELSQRIPD